MLRSGALLQKVCGNGTGLCTYTTVGPVMKVTLMRGHLSFEAFFDAELFPFKSMQRNL